MEPDDPIAGRTPLDDISGLIPASVMTRADLAIAEAENVRKATVRYLAVRPSRRLAPFTVDWACRLHAEMFGDVWRWAGTRRRSELNLGRPAYAIETDLHALMGDLASWREFCTYDIYEQAARLHHRAVLIHPFLNGNGRWSRMLANVLQKQDGVPVTAWPEQTIGRTSIIRYDYLTALQQADSGDVEPLVALHRRYAASNLAD